MSPQVKQLSKMSPQVGLAVVTHGFTEWNFLIRHKERDLRALGLFSLAKETCELYTTSVSRGNKWKKNFKKDLVIKKHFH